MSRQKVWMSWSSGKDSAYALHLLRQRPELEVAGLLTTVTEAYNRVAMHAVRVELLERQAQALGLPLHKIALPTPCSNEVYETRMGEAIARARYESISYMAFGDLFLEDVRAYREKMLAGTGIKPIFPLWSMPTPNLAKEMLKCGIKAVLTCVDPRKLDPRFTGRDYDERFLRELPEGVDPCGENGEFHTFVRAAPGFSNPIPIRVGEVVERDGFFFADVLRTTFAEKRCERCGATFGCGSTGSEHCWCTKLPPLIPLPKDVRDCLCEACLQAELSK